MYAGIAGGHGPIVPRPHGRKELLTCQVGSLGASCEPDRC